MFSKESENALAAGHWREKSDFVRAFERCLRPDVVLVDRGADHLRVLECEGIFLAAGGEPLHQLADGRDGSRDSNVLLGLADTLAHPGEIADFHLSPR